MNTAPVQIRDPETVQAIRELARRRGVPLTAAVASAVKNELARSTTLSEVEVEAKRRAGQAVLERIWAYPITGAPLTDDDLYDEHGLPK